MVFEMVQLLRSLLKQYDRLCTLCTNKKKSYSYTSVLISEFDGVSVNVNQLYTDCNVNEPMDSQCQVLVKHISIFIDCYAKGVSLHS